MEFTKFRYFLTTCECGSYSAAAKRLFTTRQAVSKAIHSLESELGTTFFYQSDNKLCLTPDGIYMRDKVSHLRDEILELQDHFTKQNELATKTLKVAVSLDSCALLPKFDAACIEDHNVNLTEHPITRCLEDLDIGRADLCILSGMQRDFPGYYCTTLFSDSLSFIVSEDVFEELKDHESGMRISDLIGYDILLLSDKENVYRDFLEKYRKLNLIEDNLHTVTDQALMARLVKGGRSVALAPRVYTENLPEGLVGIPCSNKHLSWYVTAVCKEISKGDSRITNLLEALGA